MVSKLAWLGFFSTLYNLEALEHANLPCLAPFYRSDPTTLCPREKKNIWILPTAGIEPRPPAKQASALSTTLLSLGHLMKPLESYTKCKLWLGSDFDYYPDGSVRRLDIQFSSMDVFIHEITEHSWWNMTEKKANFPGGSHRNRAKKAA